MKARTLATLLGVCLVPALGIGHCELGDARAFDSCLGIIAPGLPTPRPFAKLASFESTTSGVVSTTQLRLEVTTCSTSLTRIVDGAAETFGPSRLEPGDARALHDALVAAGGLDANSAPADFFNCPILSYSYWNEATVFEPSPLPGGAWSNSFQWGSCARSDDTAAIETLLTAWIAAHFDL